jgi:hypothetical protein
MNSSVAAGYYSTFYGPLPFGVGRVRSEDYLIMARNDVHGS